MKYFRKSAVFLKFFPCFQLSKKTFNFFKKGIDIFFFIVYNSQRREGNSPYETTECESGGTGRRARLRGVWIHRTGSSPVSRTTKEHLFSQVLFCFISLFDGSETGRYRSTASDTPFGKKVIQTFFFSSLHFSHHKALVLKLMPFLFFIFALSLKQAPYSLPYGSRIGTVCVHSPQTPGVKMSVQDIF